MKKIAKNNIKMLIIIGIVIVTLSMIFIKLNPINHFFRIPKLEKTNKETSVYEVSNDRCTIEGKSYTYKYKLKYNEKEHEILLRFQEGKNKSLSTTVYIDNKYINTIAVGNKIHDKNIDCSDLIARIYIIKSKYIGLIIGEYKNNKINYKLYIYDDNVLINKKGEEIFTRIYYIDGEELKNQNDRNNDLNDIEFDGFSFKYLVGCESGECVKISIEYNGFNIDKKEIKNQKNDESLKEEEKY